MVSAELEKQLHVYARRRVARMQRWGRTLDKRQLRFNDIVRVGMEYMRHGEPQRVKVAFYGVKQAIDACCPASPLYVKGGDVLSLSQSWMLR